MLPFLKSTSSNRRLHTSEARIPCLYATTITAHSRAPLAFAARSTERTSAGSRWVIVGLDCLKGVEPYIPVHSLGDVISFNNQDAGKRARYGQDVLERSEKTNGSLTEAEYIHERLRDIRVTRGGIDSALRNYNVDAIIFPPLNNGQISS